MVDSSMKELYIDKVTTVQKNVVSILIRVSLYLK